MFLNQSHYGKAQVNAKIRVETKF